MKICMQLLWKYQDFSVKIFFLLFFKYDGNDVIVYEGVLSLRIYIHIHILDSIIL